ncbi:MAG: 30S ribosomal protein THX [Flavobacteriales bacterium]|nr:MAG: 30S ribosomal protein THX [Flavobacteriales bacterium]
MGKGDIKTRRGKIHKGTYGNTRPRKKNKTTFVAEKPKVAAKKEITKEATTKKAVAKKTTTKKAATKKTTAKKSEKK